ncbi:hypothetical protein DP20_3405 [Shigella flexneri]|nr:hypothetical protein DP20_3405 [Shigella flexneri]
MEFDKALSDLFRLQVPEAELTHTRGINHITAVREVIQPSGGRGVLTEPRVVRDIVGQDLFLQPQQRVQQAGFTDARLPGKNADAPGQRLFQRFQPILSMAGNHQYAITDVAVDIHLLVDERHAFVVQQVYLVEHDNRLNLQGFAGHQVTVDNIERQLRQNGGDNDNLVDVGGYGFHAVVEIRTR